MREIAGFPVDGDLEARQKWFAFKLRGFSREDCILLSGRAALRVLPMFDFLIPSDQTTSQIQNALSSTVLPLLRCYSISIAAAVGSNTDKALFRSAAKSAVSEANFAIKIAMTNKFTRKLRLEGAYLPASNAALAAVRASDSYASSAAARAIALSVGAVISYDGYPNLTENLAHAPIVAFLSDVASLSQTRGVKIRRMVAAKPLWPFSPISIGKIQTGMPIGASRSGMPDQIDLLWKRFRSLLLMNDDNWSVWVQWYEDILAGEKVSKFLFGLSTERALRLLQDVALIDDETWKGRASKFNIRFNKLVDNATNEVEKNYVEIQVASDIHENKEFSTIVSSKKLSQIEISSSFQVIKLASLHADIEGYLDALDRNLLDHLDAIQSELQKITDNNARQTWREEVERIELLQSLTFELRAMIKKIVEGKAKEEEAKEQIGKFRAGLDDWWQKRHVAVFDKASDHAINAIAFTVFTIVGTAIGSVVGAPSIGMLCGAGAYSGKEAVGKFVNKIASGLS